MQASNGNAGLAAFIIPSCLDALERIDHAHSTWRFYMHGVRAAMLAGQTDRAARCLASANEWRDVLANAFYGAKTVAAAQEAACMSRPRPPTIMSPAELDAALAEIGWTLSELSRRVDSSRQFILKIRQGKAPVPARIALYLRQVRAAIAKVAPPEAPAEDEQEASQLVDAA